MRVSFIFKITAKNFFGVEFKLLINITHYYSPILTVFSTHFSKILTSYHASYFQYRFQSILSSQAKKEFFADQQLFLDHKEIVLFHIRRQDQNRYQYAMHCQQSGKYDQHDLLIFLNCNSILQE